MTATPEEAYDDVLTLFKAVWDPTGNTAIYDNVTKGKPTDEVAPGGAPEPWARVKYQLGAQFQSSLSNEAGKKRWTQTGFVVIQIFIPTGEGLNSALALAKIVNDGFRGKKTPNQVWIRNSNLDIVGVSGEWFQVNVLTDFEYDEIK